ncbi:hypothetical protein [Planctomicrobium sp. SH664]|uniref:alpha/beta hydrolase family protein n=1 Tax=Planctomicrobium sp. SH664 TaxID=3448125 RepID=UPI003F5B5A11
MQTQPGFLATFVCLVGLSAPLCAEDLPDHSTATLPNTQPLQLIEPLNEAMVRGISLYAERELERAHRERKAGWLKHSPDSAQGQQDRMAARERLKEIIGLPRQLAELPTLLRSGNDPAASGHTAPGGLLAGSRVITCQWDAFEGVTGRGLLAVPTSVRGDKASSLPLVVFIPDADQTPEACFGLSPGISESQQFARLLAEQGCLVLCPLLINRDSEFTYRNAELPHREFIYRLSFDLGQHPVGYDVAKILTGIEAVKRDLDRPLSTVVIGTSEGGLIALTAGAIAPQSIEGVAVRGYFNERTQVWREPIYRNLYGQLREFGDAEMASLIAPRPLLIENCAVPTVTRTALPDGRPSRAAPGEIHTPDQESVQREFNRASAYYHQMNAGPAATLLLNTHSNEADSRSLAALDRIITSVIPDFHVRPREADVTRTSFGNSEAFQKQRMKSQVEELVRYSQRILDRSQKFREDLWQDLRRARTVEQHISLCDKYRQLVHETFIGTLPSASVPANPRSRKVFENADCTGYEVMLDLHPAGPQTAGSALQDPGVFAGGILLVPHDLKPGEKRPVVVFQHGLEGTPQATLETDPNSRDWKYYKAASLELAKRGFVVYAPQNPYRGVDRFRILQRKSNPLGRSLFSYIVEQHRQTLNWLAGLSYVDADRIAFYGLSYGGKTAMRVPMLLVPGENRPGYCLSICSADFNDWIRKNASAESSYSYVYTNENEIFEWNMGHVANYGELAWLMIPRPFMVERGMDDPVAPDDWVSSEFARARRPYIKLNLADLAEIEIFNGPHTINGQGTYDFLHHHLNWPKRSTNASVESGESKSN